MISRVAESCFWLYRYMERVENTARLLDVNRVFLLDAPGVASERWRPFLIVAGEEPRFIERFGAERAEDGEAVQEYLTWDEDCTVSIKSSLRWARENARTIREVISLEMWECLNSLWLFVRDGEARKLYEDDRYAFYARIKESCQLFYGISHGSVLHEEPLDFMRLGMLLERAGQTSRILDVKFHTFGATEGARESAAEIAHWLALLRCCSAFEPFLKRGKTLTGPEVAGFLFLDAAFPRTIAHSIDRAASFLGRIRGYGHGTAGVQTSALLASLHHHLRSMTVADLLKRTIHHECTLVVDSVARICGAVHEDFFDPAAGLVETRATVGAAR